MRIINHIPFVETFFVLIFIIFLLGLMGILLNRHNIIILLLSFEIMYLCSTLVFSLYSYQTESSLGLFYIIFIITVVGAEACISLAIVSFYFNIAKEINLTELCWTKL
jgi:NADH-quinone oxidoreductase subunit K